MFAAAGLLSVLAGIAFACFAKRLPEHAEVVETTAGALLLGGFALVGCAMPALI